MCPRNFSGQTNKHCKDGAIANFLSAYTAMFPYLDSRAETDCNFVANNQPDLCLTSEDTADVLTEEVFTLSGVPEGATIVWQPTADPLVVPINNGLSAKITWDSSVAPANFMVTATVTLSDGRTIAPAFFVHLKGIPSNCSIGGASTVRKCCTNSLTYCLQNFGDGDMFTWTVNGWTLNSGQGTSSIKVTPILIGTPTPTPNGANAVRYLATVALPIHKKPI